MIQQLLSANVENAKQANAHSSKAKAVYANAFGISGLHNSNSVSDFDRDENATPPLRISGQHNHS